LLKVIAGERES